MILPGTFTIIKSFSGSVSKTYEVDENGRIKKIAAANMYKGKAKRMTISFNKLQPQVNFTCGK